MENASLRPSKLIGLTTKLIRRLCPFLGYELKPFGEIRPAGLERSELSKHLKRARFSVRLLRYWWAGQALKKESERLGRPLIVVDLGCERGWLKHFTPEGAVERWIGLDWNIRDEIREVARYDDLRQANFDEALPLDSGCADALVSLHVFEHLPRPGATMSEVSRLLRPGGIFLGAAPTMPDWIGRLRERYFRRRLAAGEIVEGGHITVLSPKRWRGLAQDCGLQVEFATGSHFARLTGSPVESLRLWIRLNQIWGALFPSLGSECCVQARRATAWTTEAQQLSPDDPHWRRLWIGLGVAGATACGALSWSLVNARQADDRSQFIAWMDAHQTGVDKFVVKLPWIDLCDARNDATCVRNIGELLAAADRFPDAHFLLPLATAFRLADSPVDEGWRVDSRLELRGDDYVMLRRNREGTSLDEYLRGAQVARVSASSRKS